MKVGVKTEEGKEVSKYNAVKHGILTKILLEPEVEEAKKLYHQFIEDYNPTTQTEFILIQDLATACIRKARAINAEREYFTQVLNPPVYSNDGWANIGKELSSGYKAKISNEDIEKIDKTFVRYISACERQFYRALHELQRIQALKKGQKPYSIAVDVMGERRDELH